jgi:uncharacterized protein YkwD
LVNAQRAEHGLPPLTQDLQLNAAAQAHAEDMGRRDLYAHTNPDGADPDSRIRASGFKERTTGENIHWGVRGNGTPAKIVDDWMHSPGHRANILRATFTRIGTGVGYDAPEALTDGAGVYVNNFGG